MNHLTTREILEYVDETILNGERTRVVAHLETCARCQREVEFQRALSRTVRQAPLVSPSREFTSDVMGRVLPGSQRRWYHKAASNLGYLIAMVIVLSIVGYALFSPAVSQPTEQPTMVSELLKSYADFYGKVQQLLRTETTRIDQTKIPVPAIGSEKFVAFTLMSLLILVLVDRFVLRKVIKLRR